MVMERSEMNDKSDKRLIEDYLPIGPEKRPEAIIWSASVGESIAGTKRA